MKQPAERRSTVVIVEDDLELSRMASDMVEECGLRAVLARFADIALSDSIDGIALALTTAERYPWISICVTTGNSAVRPDVLPRKVRFISKPWRAAEVLAFLEGG